MHTCACVHIPHAFFAFFHDVLLHSSSSLMESSCLYISCCCEFFGILMPNSMISVEQNKKRMNLLNINYALGFKLHFEPTSPCQQLTCAMFV